MPCKEIGGGERGERERKGKIKVFHTNVVGIYYLNVFFRVYMYM